MCRLGILVLAPKHFLPRLCRKEGKEMIDQAVKEATIKHYDEMLTYARNQPLGDKPDSWNMKMAINQNWWGCDCPLCFEYNPSGQVCDPCPLFKAGYGCGGRSPWSLMNNAETWKEWIRHASQLLTIIRGLELNRRER